MVFHIFGLFHLHRIWGLADRDSYATFWINVMERKGDILLWAYGYINGTLRAWNYYFL